MKDIRRAFADAGFREQAACRILRRPLPCLFEVIRFEPR
jgi:hypothetical protein